MSSPEQAKCEFYVKLYIMCFSHQIQLKNVQLKSLFFCFSLIISSGVCFSSSLAFLSQFLLLWCFSSVTLLSRRNRRRRSPPATRSLSLRVRCGPASRCRYTRSLFLPAVQSREPTEDTPIEAQYSTPERYSVSGLHTLK